MNDQLANTLQALDSADAKTRDAAALQLRDFAEAAVATLFRAINRPENSNNRGTLLYALMPLNCSEHFAELFSFAVCGSYEVQCHALSILQEQRFTPTDQELREARRLVDELQRDSAHVGDTQLLCTELRDILAREEPIGDDI